MAIPITYSEKWHYQVQNKIFSKLYRDTAKTEWIRGPAFIAFGKSFAIRSALLTASVGELTINGLRFTFNPYQSSEQRERGWVLIKEVPWQILDLTAGSLAVLAMGAFLITFDPEYYILSRAEHSKVDWKHAETDTFASKDHEYDTRDAISRTKKGREKWKNQLENNT